MKTALALLRKSPALSIFVLLILFVAAGVSAEKPKLGKDNIEEVINAMTPAEKIGMTVGDGKFLPSVDIKTIEQGTGIIIANQNTKLVLPQLGIWSSALKIGRAHV